MQIRTASRWSAPGFYNRSDFKAKPSYERKATPITVEGSHASRWSAPKFNQKGGPAADRFAPASRLILQ